ncbi:MAG: ABC transporter permease [Actinomycetes bacterium]
MPLARVFPTRGALRRPPLGLVDLVVAGAMVILLYALVRGGQAANAPLGPITRPNSVPVRLADLPYDAAMSVLRMVAGLIISVLFTFAYGIVAARSRRAERILVPVLDILQSVPILGFLAVTVTFFVSLAPHSIIGLQLASVFAIVTSMAWNMTFAFYHSLVSQSRDLDEASRILRLTKWQRFWRLDVPSSMIPLVWNGMMSFGGAWFFLTASEAISVSGRTYALPGIGSYAAAALAHGDLTGVGQAIGAMILIIIAVNGAFWRPMVAWAERFRTEDQAAAERPRSIVYDLLRTSRIPGLVVRPLRPVGRTLDRATRPLGLADRPLTVPRVRQRAGDAVLAGIVVLAVGYGVVQAAGFVGRSTGYAMVGQAVLMGLATLSRVVAVVGVATLVWVPVGVWIGMRPSAMRIAQPIIQVLAAFPANLLFPVAVWVFLTTGLSIDLGGVVLMAMGAQWYVLFNVIAGASAIPTDLIEAMESFQVPRWQRWRQLILPAVFPAYVTGGITAAGGAWNASIVAELVTYGHHTLAAYGLGAFITEATAAGRTGQVLVGVVVMSVLVVGVNRLFWGRLYQIAENRFSL